MKATIYLIYKKPTVMHKEKKNEKICFAHFIACLSGLSTDGCVTIYFWLLFKFIFYCEMFDHRKHIEQIL